MADTETQHTEYHVVALCSTSHGCHHALGAWGDGSFLHIAAAIRRPVPTRKRIHAPVYGAPGESRPCQQTDQQISPAPPLAEDLNWKQAPYQFVTPATCRYWIAEKETVLGHPFHPYTSPCRASAFPPLPRPPAAPASRKGGVRYTLANNVLACKHVIPRGWRSPTACG